MLVIPPACKTTKRVTRIVLEENRRKATFINNARQDVVIIRVDGCAIILGRRCDYLLLSHDQHEHFIELKGTDVIHACTQLEATIKQLSANVQTQPKTSYVVASRVIPFISTTIQAIKKRFRNQFNCNLIVKNRTLEVHL
jgi:hypothetical protein